MADVYPMPGKSTHGEEFFILARRVWGRGKLLRNQRSTRDRNRLRCRANFSSRYSCTFIR
jgi:hypothetical protein